MSLSVVRLKFYYPTTAAVKCSSKDYKNLTSWHQVFDLNSLYLLSNLLANLEWLTILHDTWSARCCSFFLFIASLYVILSLFGNRNLQSSQSNNGHSLACLHIKDRICCFVPFIVTILIQIHQSYIVYPYDQNQIV